MNYDIKVWQEDNRILTNSRNVAEVFGKRHDNVLRDIEDLLDLLKFEEISNQEASFKNNFINTTYLDNYKRSQNEYLLTKDGFTLLAMGFSGKRALQFKIAYINAFNQLAILAREQAKALQEQHTRTQELYVGMAQLAERQEAMYDYAQDDMNRMDDHIKNIKKILTKVTGELEMIDVYRARALGYEENLYPLAKEIGNTARKHGIPSPVSYLEAKADRESYRNRNKKRKTR